MRNSDVAIPSAECQHFLGSTPRIWGQQDTHPQHIDPFPVAARGAVPFHRA